MRLCDLNPHLRFASALHYAVKSNTVKVIDCRIFFITNGSAQLYIGDTSYALQPGSLFYCCGGSEYTIEASSGFSLISLNFDLTQSHNHLALPFSPAADPQEWDAMAVHFDTVCDSSFLDSHLFVKNAADLRAGIEQVVQTFSSGDRFARELSSAALKTLLIRLHSLNQAQIPPKIAQVRDYIRQNYAKNITNKELAALVGYHEYYLNRIFSTYIGTNLHNYLLTVRLNRASFLILNTDLDLQEISEQAGFGSYPHFSSYFKQVYGYSPIQYRKHLRDGI